MAVGQPSWAKEHILFRLFILKSRMVHAGGDIAYGTASFIVNAWIKKQPGTQEVSIGVLKEKEKQCFDNTIFETACQNVNILMGNLRLMDFWELKLYLLLSPTSLGLQGHWLASRVIKNRFRVGGIILWSQNFAFSNFGKCHNYVRHSLQSAVFQPHAKHGNCQANCHLMPRLL